MDTVTNSLYRYQIKCQTSSCVCVVSSPPPTLKVKPTWAGFCQIVCRNSIRNAQFSHAAPKQSQKKFRVASRASGAWAKHWPDYNSDVCGSQGSYRVWILSSRGCLKAKKRLKNFRGRCPHPLLGASPPHPHLHIPISRTHPTLQNPQCFPGLFASSPYLLES